MRWRREKFQWLVGKQTLTIHSASSSSFNTSALHLFFQCFASFYVTNFLIHSHLHLYLPLGGGSFLFMSKTFLAIMSRVILKTRTLIYLQLRFLVLDFSLSLSLLHFATIILKNFASFASILLISTFAYFHVSAPYVNVVIR